MGSMNSEAQGITRRERPIGRCMRCGTAFDVRDIEVINTDCGRTIDGKLCRGSNRSALGQDDWLACSHCATTGYSISSASAYCERCGGAGWLYMRPEAVWDADYQNLVWKDGPRASTPARRDCPVPRRIREELAREEPDAP
jgi:hypothetical protein